MITLIPPAGTGISRIPALDVEYSSEKEELICHAKGKDVEIYKPPKLCLDSDTTFKLAETHGPDSERVSCFD